MNPIRSGDFVVSTMRTRYDYESCSHASGERFVVDYVEAQDLRTGGFTVIVNCPSGGCHTLNAGVCRQFTALERLAEQAE